jgi:hypothetical protein
VLIEYASLYRNDSRGDKESIAKIRRLAALSDIHMPLQHP